MMKPILPGSTIGIVGGGHLARLLAQTARQMGYRSVSFAPPGDMPPGQIADDEVTASYDDLDAVAAFARRVDVVTSVFENVPAAASNAVEKLTPFRPSGSALHIAQHRLREKQFLTHIGVPHAPYRHVQSLAGLRRALESLMTPGIIKPLGYGTEGIGHVRIDSASQSKKAWEDIGAQESVLESLVEFAHEVSVVAARGHDGDFVHYGLAQNSYANQILDVTMAPAPAAPESMKSAIDITRAIAEGLEIVGVICVEFFVTEGGYVLVNEITPCPHNSGLWTIEGSVTSQFEHQLRAVCGLPLGSVDSPSPAAATANLPGDLWTDGDAPDWSKAVAYPDVKLHLYGRSEPRPGRRMGHMTSVSAKAVDAAVRVKAARQALARPAS